MANATTIIIVPRAGPGGNAMLPNDVTAPRPSPNRDRRYRAVREWSAPMIPESLSARGGAPPPNLDTIKDSLGCAPVAQLDRAFASGAKGRWFESTRAYQQPESSQILTGIALRPRRKSGYSLGAIEKRFCFCTPDFERFGEIVDAAKTALMHHYLGGFEKGDPARREVFLGSSWTITIAHFFARVSAL